MQPDRERVCTHRADQALSEHRRTALVEAGKNNRAIDATTNARGADIERLHYTIKSYSKNIKELGKLDGIEIHTDPGRLENDDLQLAQAGLHVRFKFDGKGPIGLNDGEASGGQQVMKSLILLIELTPITSKKKKENWAQSIFVLQRRVKAA